MLRAQQLLCCRPCGVLLLELLLPLPLLPCCLQCGLCRPQLEQLLGVVGPLPQPPALHTQLAAGHSLRHTFALFQDLIVLVAVPLARVGVDATGGVILRRQDLLLLGSG